MGELNYKELQKKGVFDVPYKAFEFMQKQQTEIDGMQKQINKVNTQLEIWRNWCDINENHNAHEFVFECADELEKALRCE
jgi:hypothetical protein